MNIDTFFFPSAKYMLHANLYNPSEFYADHAVVLFCAGFAEFNFNYHTEFTLLITEFIKHNYSVMTFDFRKTGNSFGKGSSSSLMGWSEDISAAEKYLRNRYKLSKIYLVGFNLGASALFLAQQKSMIYSDKILLIDPVISGADFIQSENKKNRVKYIILKLKKSNTPKNYQDFLGYAISDKFIEDIKELNLLDVKGLREKEVRVYYNPDSVDYVAQIESFSNKLNHDGLRFYFSQKSISIYPKELNKINERRELYNFLIRSMQ